MVNITKIEGIGPVSAGKLHEQGIRTTEGLLEAAGDSRGRRQLAAKSGLAQDLILDWVNKADLMRVRGVGEEYSDLLEAAGVDTVKELRNRNPNNLHKKMLVVNEEKHLVRRLPAPTEVDSWVQQAKTMQAVVTY